MSAAHEENEYNLAASVETYMSRTDAPGAHTLRKMKDLAAALGTSNYGKRWMLVCRPAREWGLMAARAVRRLCVALCGGGPHATHPPTGPPSRVTEGAAAGAASRGRSLTEYPTEPQSAIF